MKIILSILIFNSFICADFIELYRLHGIDAVKKEFDKQMKTKRYWDKYLLNNDVRYGYYESIESVLVCTKRDKEIVLHVRDNKKFKQAFKSSVLIGKKTGDKRKEGDLKTPVGVYKLTKKLTKLDPFYGPLALVTSYPNLYDKVKKKSGSGIWIHGLPFDKKRDNFTKGCVALDNQKLKQLNSKIDYKKSILLLTEDKLAKVSKDDIGNILYQIFIWKDAWQNGDIDTYLSFYDESFSQVNGMTLSSFIIKKTRIFKRARDKKISLTNINISPYASKKHEKIFRILMDEDYKAKYYKFKGTKELYIKLSSDGKISILTEG